MTTNKPNRPVTWHTPLTRVIIVDGALRAVSTSAYRVVAQVTPGWPKKPLRGGSRSVKR